VIVTEIETHPKTTGEQDGNRPVRIGAIGDLHLRDEIPVQLTREMRAVDSQVDLVVIAGDITDGGRLPEGELAYELLCEIKTPMIAVLGNHDRRGPSKTDRIGWCKAARWGRLHSRLA